MNIKELIEIYGDSNENWLILEFLLKKNFLELKCNLDLSIDDVYELFLEIIEKRKNHYPLQYIFGKWEFYGLELFVDDTSLIPRFETEILVDEILKLNCKKNKILDIGCGTGAIGLSLAKNLKNSNVIGIDISKESINLSNRNKIKLNINNINFFQSDIFSNVNDRNFDIIVSNPPYINKEDMKNLEKEVLYEPEIALYGGEDGLFFYKKIIHQAFDFLSEDGILAFEIGYNQLENISSMLIEKGFNILVAKKDFAGFDRILIAKRR